jgi:hypothetical protein
MFSALLLIFGIGLGVGVAYSFNKFCQPTPVSATVPVNIQSSDLQQAKTPGANIPNQGWNNNRRGMMGSGMKGQCMMGGWNNNVVQGYWGMEPVMMGRGMMGNWQGSAPSGQRLTIDQALVAAKNHFTGYGQDLAATEIMEFRLCCVQN